MKASQSQPEKHQNNVSNMFKVNNKGKWRQWRRSGVFIINFKQISHIVLVFKLMNWNKEMPAGLSLPPACRN